MKCRGDLALYTNETTDEGRSSTYIRTSSQVKATINAVQTAYTCYIIKLNNKYSYIIPNLKAY